MPGVAAWFLSWLSPSAGSQCRMSQNEPVSRKLRGVDQDADLAGVTGDAGQRVVELVDQLHLAHAELVHLVELAVDVGVGRREASSFIVQPNGTEVSMPMTTAIFPALITLRAWNGFVTIR